MKTIQLNASVRDMKVNANNLRKTGFVPAEYYGNKKDNAHLTVEYHAFRKAFVDGGYNTVVDLAVDGKSHKVLVQDVQIDPVSDMYSHVDFYAVDMNKEVSTTVPLKFVGASEAVKSLSAILVTMLDEVNVTCLVKNLVSEIEVDLGLLQDFSSVIHISDIKVPEGIVIDNDPETAVAIVERPKTAEEIAAEEAADAEAAKAAMEAVKAEPVEPAEDGKAEAKEENKKDE